MSETVSFTGGARLGWMHGTWPFGRLAISSGRLTISLAFAGRYTFAPSEVAPLLHVLQLVGGFLFAAFTLRLLF